MAPWLDRRRREARRAIVARTAERALSVVSAGFEIPAKTQEKPL